jgi:hypothetical protein
MKVFLNAGRRFPGKRRGVVVNRIFKAEKRNGVGWIRKNLGVSSHDPLSTR